MRREVSRTKGLPKFLELSINLTH